ncbi:MAG: GldG family protein [Oscillospiraceae bacterium]|nr:GldG family protein [Oscillospiraceae bacterium]
MTRKKLKYGGISLLFTALFLTIAILLNIFAAMLTERFFLKADLTDTGIYSIHDNAAEFLRGIEETVDVVVLSEEEVWLTRSPLVVEILSNYAATSGGRLRVQYVNPDLNSFNGPRYGNSLAELKAAHDELQDMTRNDIILLSSRRAARVPFADLFSWNHEGREVLRADQELVSALSYVLNDGLASAVFLEGHRESGAALLTEIFERGGYAVSSVNLVFEDIPADADVLISVAPLTDFLDEELVKLEHYLSTGGNAMIFYEFSLPPMPNLDRFLAEWGIGIEDKIVFDEAHRIAGQPFLLGAQVRAGILPFTEDAETATSGFPGVGVPFARPLRAVWGEGTRNTFTVFPLIQTFSAASYAKDLSQGGITTPERESDDDSGPFVLAYNTRYHAYDVDRNLVFSNLIVAGAEMISDSFLLNYGDYFYNNAFLRNLANDLNPFGESVFIPSKTAPSSQMPVSSGAARFVLILMVVLLPLAIMAAGIWVWRKRRHQ